VVGAVKTVLNSIVNKKTHHIICTHDISIKDYLQKYETTFVDFRDPQKLHKALQENTKLVMMDSISCLTLNCYDVRVIADVVH